MSMKDVTYERVNAELGRMTLTYCKGKKMVRIWPAGKAAGKIRDMRGSVDFDDVPKVRIEKAIAAAEVHASSLSAAAMQKPSTSSQATTPDRNFVPPALAKPSKARPRM